MGIKLERGTSYQWKTSTGQKIVFTNGEVRHDIPEDLTSFLLETGRFRFVPSPNQEAPAEVKAVDETYRLRAEGLINRDGFPTKKAEQAVNIQAAKANVVAELDLDEEGNVVSKMVDRETGEPVGEPEKITPRTDVHPLRKKAVARSL